MTGTLFDDGQPEAKDAIDRPSSRPNFLVLCYPVISLSTEYGHGGSLRNLLGENLPRDSQKVRTVSTELQVKANTPPTFIFQTDEDAAVPAENCLLFYMALRKHKIPAEMHVYQRGPHGVGLMRGDPILETWGEHLKGWLRTNQFLAPGERAAAKGKVSLNGIPVSWGSITFTPKDPNQAQTTIRIRRGQFNEKKDSGPVVGNGEVQFTLSTYEATRDSEDAPVRIGPNPVAVQSGENEYTFEFKAP